MHVSWWVADGCSQSEGSLSVDRPTSAVGLGNNRVGATHFTSTFIVTRSPTAPTWTLVTGWPHAYCGLTKLNLYSAMWLQCQRHQAMCMSRYMKMEWPKSNLQARRYNHYTLYITLPKPQMTRSKERWNTSGQHIQPRNFEFRRQT